VLPPLSAMHFQGRASTPAIAGGTSDGSTLAKPSPASPLAAHSHSPLRISCCLSAVWGRRCVKTAFPVILGKTRFPRRDSKQNSPTHPRLIFRNHLGSRQNIQCTQSTIPALSARTSSVRVLSNLAFFNSLSHLPKLLPCNLVCASILTPRLTTKLDLLSTILAAGEQCCAFLVPTLPIAKTVHAHTLHLSRIRSLYSTSRRS
jgi:hypothetical protein